MTNRKSPRFARQIPESLIFAMILACSSVLGLPIVRKLHDYFPTANKRLLALVGMGVALLLLVSLLVALHLWLSRDTPEH